MTITIKEGGFYRTRDGQKLGPMYPTSDNGHFPWRPSEFEHPRGVSGWANDGLYTVMPQNDDRDIVAEWVEGPVRKRTIETTDILPGVYGKVRVNAVLEPAGVQTERTVSLSTGGEFTASELRAAAQTLTELADALDAQAAERETAQ